LQPKTLRVYLAILANPRFSQRGLLEVLNRDGSVSIGFVNEVVNDLVLKRLVERSRRTFMETVSTVETASTSKMAGGYVLSDAVGMLNLISLFRRMPELRLFSRTIRAGRKDVVRELAGRDVVFCLGSAMEMYSSHFRPEEVSFYASDAESVLRFLAGAPAGNTRVSCYRPDYVRDAGGIPALFQDPLFAGKSRNVARTSKVQTAIDMFCDGKGAYAAPLLEELWGVSP